MGRHGEGAYTLTEKQPLHGRGFSDISITYRRWGDDDKRWVFDGLDWYRSRRPHVSNAAVGIGRLAIVRKERSRPCVKKRPSSQEVTRLRETADRLAFDVLYAPADGTSRPIHDESIDGAETGDYARLIGAADPQAFYAGFRSDIRPTTDDRPFFFHTTKLQDQFSVAFGKSMLFGNGLSALLTLLGISAALVVIFVLGRWCSRSAAPRIRPAGLAWLVYFGALGAGSC